MIEHRKYLLSYGESWLYGYFKNILENPPCTKPGAAKNKQYEYELERVKSKKEELYLHLMGEGATLDEVETQLAKFKIAKFVDENSLLILIDELMSQQASYHEIKEYCREKGLALVGRRILK